jgi:hypothetical protein
MKSLLLKSVSSLVACMMITPLGGASPLIPIGDKAAIYFNGNVSVTSDSNVLLDESGGIDDLIVQLRPGLEWAYGNAESGTQLNLKADYAMRRFVDHDEFNSDYPSIAFTSELLSAKSKSYLNASYLENQTNSRFSVASGRLIESKDSVLALGTDYRASLKSAFVGSVEYRNEEKNLGADTQTLTLPFNLYYAATEKLDLGLGYRFRDSSVSQVFGRVFGDRQSHFLNLALRGELSPKVVANLKFGYQNTEVSGATDFDGLSFDSQLSYIPNAKTSLSMAFRKDFMVGFQGEVVDNTTSSLTLDYSANAQWSVSGTLSYATDDYQLDLREQEFYYAKAAVIYDPSQYLTVRADAVFQKNDSNQAQQSFDATILTLSLAVRY